MRKALLAFTLAAIAGAGVALAQSNAITVSASTSTTAACTALDAGAGVTLSEMEGYSVTISADRTDGGVQTILATAGTMDCCFYGAISADALGKASGFRWMDCPPSLDVSVSTACVTGKRDCALGSFLTPDGYGRIAYVPNAVPVDGGATLTTTVTARRRK